MQQGYIPPKQQNNSERNRRAERHKQTEKQDGINQRQRKRKIWLFVLPLVIIAFILLVRVSDNAIKSADILATIKYDETDIQQYSQSEYTVVPLTAKPTNAPTSTVTPTATPMPTVKPYDTLSQGSHGDDVKRMQTRLIQLDYLNDTADGIFGNNTLSAVIAFQRQNGLNTTGIADNTTLVELYSSYAAAYTPLQYSAGMYKVGYDIEPGEYIILANSSISAYFCLSNDSNGSDIIANDNFDYNSIITVRSGEYLEISRARMMLLSEFVKHYSIPTNIDGTMYKVGTNLSAGEYKLVSTSDYGGYYCIYESSRQDEIIANDNFENRTYVTVKRGQYLVLSRCKISQ